LNANPDPPFHLNANPDPIFHFIAVLDPAPHQSVVNPFAIGLQQCCESGMFIPNPDFYPFWIPDPDFTHPGSRIPDHGFRITLHGSILNFDFYADPDPAFHLNVDDRPPK
jgi:hypothetical protein